MQTALLYEWKAFYEWKDHGAVFLKQITSRCMCVQKVFLPPK